MFVAVTLRFTGNLHYRFDSDSFTVEASYFDDLTVKYDAIDGIEYREGNVDRHPNLRRRQLPAAAGNV